MTTFFTVVFFHSFCTLCLILCLWRLLILQGSWVVTSSLSRQWLGQNNEWTVTELQCSNESRMSEEREREASGDVLSQRIFSRIRSASSAGYTLVQNNKGTHTHTHTQIQAEKRPRGTLGCVQNKGTHTISEYVATWLELWGSWGPHMSEQSIIPHSLLLLLLTRSQTSKNLPSLCPIHSSAKKMLSPLINAL